MATQKTKTSGNNSDVEKNKNMAVLSYVWILCLVPLLGKKDSEFVQFHAKQGLILFIASLFAFVPFFGQLLIFVIIIISVIGIIKTYNGEKWEIPFVYELSKKINL